MQEILFFFSLSLPTTLSTHLFLWGGGGADSRILEVLMILNLMYGERAKS